MRNPQIEKNLKIALNIPIKCINQPGNNLGNAGVDVKTVVNVLNIPKDAIGSETHLKHIS